MPIGTTPFADRFTEWTPLARGAEGRLYRVLDRWTRRLGALKVGEGDAARDALTGEFRLLSVLRHPCLIRSEDLCTEGGSWAHLLEYVPAVEPARLWEEGGEEAVRAAVVQTLRALTYLHRAGFVHGDVAPGNVLVWREGGRWRARLADLGLTLPIDQAARAGIRGTPGYLAPEVARGEGLTPASDLYSLAATAAAWIDGRGPWDGMGSAQIIRTLSTGAPLPKPRRRISPELESLLGALGAPDPKDRTRWDWVELRRDESQWGPPTGTATVSGLAPWIREWTEWSSALPEGTVGSLILRGRLGTGRTTAVRALGRSLVADGWAGIWQFPRWVGRQSERPGDEGRDPVLIARELGRAMQDRDVVLFWPERMPDAETRALRGFLAAREDASSSARTVVLKTASLEADDPDLNWLLGATRTRLVDWTTPGADAIDSMRRDLFPPEEGVTPGPGFRADTTPLALELHKQAAMTGPTLLRAEGGVEALTRELARLWDRASLPSRQSLALLAWSDLGWTFEELASVFEWDENTRASVFAEWNRLRLTRRRFEHGRAVDALTDELTRAALLDRASEALPGPTLDRLGEGLERGGLHGGDLGLARRLLAGGRDLPGYLIGSLNSALAAGRFEEILELASDAALQSATMSREAWRVVLTAAQRSGKYEAEVRALRRLISGTEDSSVLEERKMLAQALANMGDWQGALEECRHIAEDAGSAAPPRIWAELQSAETLWQAGRFSEADQAYERLSQTIAPEMKEEWLRFAVGRARQHGQRGDMAGVKRYLELAESTVGKARCEQDPMYLNTLGGVLIESAKLEEAKPILELARGIASDRAEWHVYIMIASRAATLTYDLGQMIEAGKLGGECVATAEALDSKRMMGFTNTFQGYAETHLGGIGTAFRRAQRVLDLSGLLSDLNLELLGQRLRLFVSSNVGWQAEVETSAARARTIATQIGEKGSLAFVSHYEGMYSLGLEDYGTAANQLEIARREFSESGQKGSEIRSRLYAEWALCQAEPSTERIGDLKLTIGALGDQASISLQPIGVLALFHFDPDFRVGHQDLGHKTLMSLWASGRVLDVIQWGPTVLSHCDSRQEAAIRATIVNAVKRAASSLDDVQLKRQFLGYPRTRRALQAVNK